jgi:hypothetical protein
LAIRHLRHQERKIEELTALQAPVNLRASCLLFRLKETSRKSRAALGIRGGAKRNHTSAKMRLQREGQAALFATVITVPVLTVLRV